MDGSVESLISKAVAFVEHDFNASFGRDIEESNASDEDREPSIPELGRTEDSEYSGTPDRSSHWQNSNQHSPPEEEPNSQPETSISPSLVPPPNPEIGTTPASQPCSSHTLEELPEISAVGPSATEYLETYEWLAPQLYNQGRNEDSGHSTANELDDITFDATCDQAGLWPLRSDDEAILLRYFITDLSHWVRLVDHSLQRLSLL